MIPKENLDLNRERPEKNQKFLSYIEDNRIFGKDLKNAQSNSFLPHTLKTTLIDKNLNKNVKNFKIK
jgi:hypothetical protein